MGDIISPGVVAITVIAIIISAATTIGSDRRMGSTMGMAHITAHINATTHTSPARTEAISRQIHIIPLRTNNSSTSLTSNQALAGVVGVVDLTVTIVAVVAVVVHSLVITTKTRMVEDNHTINKATEVVVAAEVVMAVEVATVAMEEIAMVEVVVAADMVEMRAMADMEEVTVVMAAAAEVVVAEALLDMVAMEGRIPLATQDTMLLLNSNRMSIPAEDMVAILLLGAEDAVDDGRGDQCDLIV